MNGPGPAVTTDGGTLRPRLANPWRAAAQLTPFLSLDQAAAVARGLAPPDGGGRRRVYSTKLDVDDNRIGREVLDRMLVDRVARRFGDPAGSGAGRLGRFG